MSNTQQTPFWEDEIKTTPRRSQLFELERKASWVYFASDNIEYFKIGKSTDPERRIYELRRFFPKNEKRKLFLVKTFEGGLLLERFFHDKFDHLRVKGEWFEMDKEIFQFIAEHYHVK